jgi:hypothetical protein
MQPSYPGWRWVLYPSLPVLAVPASGLILLLVLSLVIFSNCHVTLSGVYLGTSIDIQVLVNFIGVLTP